MACACNNRLGGLAYRTPAEYLAAAKRSGNVRDWRAAALAFATAEAAQRGDKRLAAQGLAGLKSLTGALGDVPVTLDREQIQAKFAQLAQQQAAANAETIRAASAIAGLVITALQAAGSAITDLQARATYATVLQVIQFAIASAAGTPATMPVLSTDAVLGLVSFCGVWGTARPIVASAISSAAGGVALRDRSAAAAIQTLGNIVLNVGDGLCNDPQVRAAAAASQVAAPGNCQTLACPAGQVPRARADGSGCDCGPPTDVSPLALARRNWIAAMSARKLVEGALRIPGPLQARAAQINCASSCTLYYWEQRLIAAKVAAGQPATTDEHVTSGGRTPPSATPRRYIDSASAPSGCNCIGVTLLVRDTPGQTYDQPDDGGGGGGGGIAVVGGVALLAFLASRMLGM